MQLFIGRIHSSTTEADLYEHFQKYGKIKYIRIKGNYGFLVFEEDSDARKALNDNHFINGNQLNLEQSAREIRGSPDIYSERKRVRTSYEPREGSRSPCEYCDRCDIHGRKRFRRYEDRDRYDRRRYENEYKKDSYRSRNFDGGHPNDKFKVVIDNLVYSADKFDLIELARSLNLEPVFTRISTTGHHGILEFSSSEQKEEALIKMNGIDFRGRVITVRPYFVKENSKFEEKEPENNIYDDIDLGLEKRLEDDFKDDEAQ